ncbi:MAG TPA: homocysteine S-methyltransferase family protein [bacterium]
MKKFSKRLKEKRIIIADGAMGTMLIDRGLKAGECPELFNETNPEMISEINRKYLDAGAEILETCTFGANPLKLARHKLEHRFKEINKAAVAITRAVAGSKAYVAACIGPSGRIMKPFGDTEPAAVQSSYERQMQVLIHAGIDIIWVETMTDLREAVIAVQAAKKEAPHIPVFAAMTFDKTRRGYFTIMGNNIEQVVKELEAVGADAVGSNCGNGIGNMIEIATQFARSARVPISIRPNAGLPVLKANKPVYPESPGFFAEKAQALVSAGVRIIGGCCGTTPLHIAVIRNKMDSTL